MENKTEKTKSNKGLVVALIIVLVLLVGCVGFIIGSNNFLKKDEVVEKEENEKKEKVSEDIVLNEDIENKIEKLESVPITANNNSYYRESTIYVRDVTNKEISIEKKLYTILEQLYWENEGRSPVTTNYNCAPRKGLII